MFSRNKLLIVIFLIVILFSVAATPFNFKPVVIDEQQVEYLTETSKKLIFLETYYNEFFYIFKKSENYDKLKKELNPVFYELIISKAQQHLENEKLVDKQQIIELAKSKINQDFESLNLVLKENNDFKAEVREYAIKFVLLTIGAGAFEAAVVYLFFRDSIRF